MAKNSVLAIGDIDSDLFKAVVEDMPDGIQIVGFEGKVMYSNKAVKKIYGFSAKELKGKDVNQMNADPTFASKVILPGLKKNGKWSGELLVKHKDGHIFPIWRSVSIIFGRSGKPVAMVGVIHDLTGREAVENKLRESEEKYRTIVENSNNLIWILDKKGRITFINKRAEEFGGYKLEEIRGKQFNMGLKNKDLPRIMAVFKKVLSGAVQEYEVDVRNRNGNIFTLSVNTAPIFSGDKITGTVSFGNDITERRAIDDAKKKLNQELHAKVEELERFNKLTVGRELKMIELKKRIAELEGKK